MASTSQMMKYKKRFSTRRVPLRYRLLLGFSVPLIIWLIVSGVNVISLNESVTRSEQLFTSQRTILLANEYLNAVLGALAAKRGYIITSDAGFLNPYRRASERLNILHARLAQLSAETPEQDRRLEEAGNLVQRWLHDVADERIAARQQLTSLTLRSTYELEERLLVLQDAHLRMEEQGPPKRELLAALSDSLRAVTDAHASFRQRGVFDRAVVQLSRYVDGIDNNDRDAMNSALKRLNALLMRTIREVVEADRAIRAVVGSDEGDILLREFQQLMNQFIDVEEAAMQRNRQEMMRTTERGKLLVRTGPLIGLAFMMLVAIWMGNRIARSLSSVIEAANELARGNMNARAEVCGRDEFAVLAERFNGMAEFIGDRSRESAALAELGELLQSCGSTNEATRIFARLAGNILSEHAGVLYLLSPSRDDVMEIASWGGGEAFSESEFPPVDCWALRLGRTHRSTEGNTMYCEHMRRHEQDTICLPLHAFGETIGMLLIVTPRGRIAEQQHLDFLETVAEQLALALANLRMREKLRNQSIRDALTGLYNRRHLDESLRRELHRAARHGTPLSVLVFDIDHFKRFNDTHGHDGGDAVLRAVGHCLQEFFRAEDGAYRAGGEEFVAVLAETSPEDALVRAEALRKAIESMEVHHENVSLPAVSISIGVASYPLHGRSADQLLKAADRALYHAKENGRNQVVVAAPGMPGQ